VIGGCSSTAAIRLGRAAARAKFPTLTEPYAGFHQMVFTEESTTAAFLLRARREGVRDFGACMAPFTGVSNLQGSRRCRCGWRDTSRTRASSSRFSPARDGRRRRLPDLPHHPDHALAQRLLPKGCGAVFSFNLKGTREQGRKFIEALRIFSHLATSATRSRW
jgi:O-acetylhomoserine (thiol)-lyase